MSEEAKLLLYVMKFFGLILLMLTLAWAAGLGMAVSNWGKLEGDLAVGVGWVFGLAGIFIVIGWLALAVSVYAKVDYLTDRDNATKKEGKEAEETAA